MEDLLDIKTGHNMGETITVYCVETNLRASLLSLSGFMKIRQEVSEKKFIGFCWSFFPEYQNKSRLHFACMAAKRPADKPFIEALSVLVLVLIY